jgi:hypothetical protein
MSHKIVKRTLPLGQLRSQIDDSSSVNEETRTVELTWSTGFKGLRQGWDGTYYEELSMEPNHVDMTRLQSGAPLLDAHNSYSNNAVIGVVERAWIENGVGKATVRFSADAEADKIYQKVKEKILRNVSVGYMVRKYEDVTKKGEQTPTYRATNWQPHEISIVPIGFDPSAQVRSSEIQNEVEIETITEASVETSLTTEKENSAMTEAEKRALELAAKEQEKQRQLEIRQAVRDAKLESSFADQLCKEDITPDEARKRVIAKIAEVQPAPVQNVTRVETGKDEKDKKRDAIENALLHRIMPEQFALNDAGREVRGMDLIRMCALLTGNQYGTDSEIATRAMSSSDLPLLLANIAEKSVQKSYQIAPSTFEKWVVQRTLRNYKKHHQVKLGDFPSLQERGEDGEFTEGEFGEGEETVQLKKYGGMLSMTEEMIVNDDTGSLSEFLQKAGASAKRLESKLVYDRLQASTDMADGEELFASAHNNLGTSGAISETTVDELNQKLKNQKTLDDEDYLDLMAKYLICGLQNETAARKFLSTIIPNQSSSVNPFANSMELIVDPRITSKNWFMAADKSQIESIVLYRLLGKEQPVVSTRNKWETGSFQIKVEHVAAAQAMEHRGITKNPYT